VSKKLWIGLVLGGVLLVLGLRTGIIYLTFVGGGTLVIWLKRFIWEVQDKRRKTR